MTTTPTSSKIPAGYEWPGGEAVASSTGPLYWLAPHENDHATTTYMVIAALPEGQHIAAQDCYLHWGVRIVDGLRATGS